MQISKLNNIMPFYVLFIYFFSLKLPFLYFILYTINVYIYIRCLALSRPSSILYDAAAITPLGLVSIQNFILLFF